MYNEDLVMLIIGIVIGLVVTMIITWIRTSSIEIGTLLVDDNNEDKSVFRFVFDCDVEDIKNHKRVIMTIQRRELNQPYNEDQDEGL